MRTKTEAELKREREIEETRLKTEREIEEATYWHQLIAAPFRIAAEIIGLCEAARRAHDKGRAEAFVMLCNGIIYAGRELAGLNEDGSPGPRHVAAFGHIPGFLDIPVGDDREETPIIELAKQARRTAGAGKWPGAELNTIEEAARQKWNEALQGLLDASGPGRVARCVWPPLTDAERAEADDISFLCSLPKQIWKDGLRAERSEQD